MYRKIDHIGIAVRSIEEALRVYTGLGFQADQVEDVAAQKTRVAMLPIGASRLELLESTEPDSPIARFLAKRGEGLHHICFRWTTLPKSCTVSEPPGSALLMRLPGPELISV